LRSYIFTDRERRIVEALLRGERVSRVEVAKIKHRIRRFTQLSSDVELYLRLKASFAESEGADST